ncbi:proteinase B [Savitreella phatthalungensis]
MYALQQQSPSWVVSSRSTQPVFELLHPSLQLRIGEPRKTWIAQGLNAALIDDANSQSLIFSLAALRGISVSPNQLSGGLERDFVRQDKATWNLERITTPGPVQDTERVRERVYSYWWDRSIPKSSVDVLIMDSGIHCRHIDFEGRCLALPSTNFVEIEKHALDSSDKHGHGTCTAGLIGSSTLGVCKFCHLISLKIFPAVGEPTSKSVHDAILWVIQHARVRRTILNASFRLRDDEAVRTAFEAVLSHDIPIVTSAGNYGYDACRDHDLLPRSIPGTIVVGGTDPSDRLVESSSYGLCVDLYAPGQSLQTTFWSSEPDAPDNLGALVDGTSAAAAVAAGTLALTLARLTLAGHVWSTAQLKQAFINIADPAVIHPRYSIDAGSSNLIVQAPFSVTRDNPAAASSQAPH